MSRIVEVQRGGGEGALVEDRVAVEEPLEIRVGTEPVVVTMRTPGHDGELAVGLLTTEGVLKDVGDVVSVKHCEAVEAASAGNVLVVELKRGAAVDLAPVRRGFYVSSSCGVCGKASIEQVRWSAEPVSDGFVLDVDVLRSLPGKLRSEQKVFDQTGGLHAAGLFDGDGALLCLREDVGRHNAVDKVIGWSVLAGRWPLDDHVLMVSGRSSFEILQKALKARVPVVAAVSAASSLAVELAEAGNQTLVGFLRGEEMTVYCGGERIRHGGT
ncbi:MAG: formate dehydrogenase accessory sulfurtransferase FdhD [Phycisphaerae bacterium]